MAEKQNDMALCVSLGFAGGAIIGAGLGLVTKNLAAWLAASIGCGIAIGAAIGGFLGYKGGRV